MEQEATTTSTIRADGRGRILLPKPLRQQLGIEAGANVTVEHRADGSVVLRDFREERRRRISEARGSFKGRGGSVDDLIAQRREEAVREEAERNKRAR